ncbi:hypothetical protein ACQ3G6_17705 [Allorhizobium undicola]|uniref:hypothetical protein n=1 Tax=Allorhizobium undicola TaxID=78527 RepID=UPI003D3352F8
MNEIIGSSIESIEIRKDQSAITFSNGFRLNTSTPLMFGSEPINRYIGDIVLSWSRSDTGISIRFLRNWPIVVDLDNAEKSIQLDLIRCRIAE